MGLLGGSADSSYSFSLGRLVTRRHVVERSVPMSRTDVGGDIYSLSCLGTECLTEINAKRRSRSPLRLVMILTYWAVE